MDCCRWLFSPCICLCPCLEDNEYLLPGRSRRATLSVSTHDDDWDAEVGFENDPKRSNGKMKQANATMSSEMQLQMQQLSRNTPRSMQNVMVTEDDDSVHMGTATNSSSWNGYTATADMDRDDSSHNLSPKKGPESGTLSKNNSNTNLGGRAPYRDIPYTDATSAAKGNTNNANNPTNEAIAPQNVNVSIGDDDSDEEVEISLL